MLPDPAELTARVVALRGTLFVEVTAVGLALALAVAAVGRRLSGEGRERVVVAASLAMLVWFAGPAPTAAFAAWALAFVVAAEVGVVRRVGRGVAVALLAVMVVAPVAAIAALGEVGPRAREAVAFGTNMALLRAIAWMRARWHGTVERVPIGRLFLAFFFFPTFLNGPIERAPALVRPLAPVATRDVRAGLARVGTGIVRIVAAALVMPLDGPNALLAGGPELAPSTLWLRAAQLYVWFYLSFSAWTDVAIGLARLAGRPGVVENFDRPWEAIDPADFWRRWHLSLGLWLRDNVYIPLGGNRRHRALNVGAVFAASAAWHVWGALKLLGFGYYPPRAWLGFAVWGALHAAAVAATPRLPAARSMAARRVRRVATFFFAAFAWVPFFSGGLGWREMLATLGRMLLLVEP